MRDLTPHEIYILHRHSEWVESNGAQGKRANLRGADLRGADLRDANLYGANLRGANLRSADLHDADLRGANLRDADLRGANLRSANLRDANLYGANLRGANLRSANLYGANLDYSCFPLWCGSTKVKVDDRFVAQLLFHLTRLDDACCSGGVREAMAHIRNMAVSDLFCEYRTDISKLA